jgi:hypothetical protein
MDVDFDQINVPLICKLMQYVIALGIMNRHKIDVWVLIKKLLKFLNFSVCENCFEDLTRPQALPHRS